VANGESVGFGIPDITYATIGVEAGPDTSTQCDFFSSKGYRLGN
jgi:hypothetical protein